MDTKLQLNSLSYHELENFVTNELQLSKYRAGQLWNWIWAKNCLDFEEMSDVSKETHRLLREKAYLFRPTIEKVSKSKDGTTKFLLKLEDGELIETVLIPSISKDGKVRITQCLSTQVGCAMACSFCSTGKLGFKRNMSMGEILGQVQAARAFLEDYHPEHPIIRNLVFMGMGEPLLNFENLMKSLETLHHKKGLAFSTRRITVSTCGIQKGLKELGESNLAYLAVSLHAPTQEKRAMLMPKAAAWHLEDLLSALESYTLHTRERMTLEYLVLGGVNDTPQDAKELIKICSRLKAKLNLIPYNDTPGSPYKAPSFENLLRFEKALWAKNVTAIIRKSKGQDIEAACGQLRAEYELSKQTL
jgi:23S rRNA (adenine2503-C2)-methyltransferase